MAGFNKTPRIILKFIHLPPRIIYAIGLGSLIGDMVLLLTTTGRKSGHLRVTPLQYEEIDGKIYLAAALGSKADWVRNIQADPQVRMHIKSRKISGLAQVVDDAGQIADFLETRLERHPAMISAMLRSDGVPIPPGRDDLIRYGQHLTLVVVDPK